MGFFRGEYGDVQPNQNGSELVPPGGDWEDSTVKKLWNRWQERQTERALARQERQRENAIILREEGQTRRFAEQEASRKKQKQPDPFFFQKLPIAERTHPSLRSYDGLACARLVGSNHVEYFDKQSKKPAFVDAGQRVSVSPPPTTKAVEQGLRHVAERNANQIRVSGSPDFLKQTAAAAVKMGIADRLKGMPEKLMQQAYQSAAAEKAKAEVQILQSERENHNANRLIQKGQPQPAVKTPELPEPSFLKDIKELARQKENQRVQTIGVAEVMAKPSAYKPQKEVINDKCQPQIEYREVEKAKAIAMDEARNRNEKTKALDADLKAGNGKAGAELEAKKTARGIEREARARQVKQGEKAAEDNLKTSLINISGRPNSTQRLAEQLTALENYHQERAKVYERAQIGICTNSEEVKFRHMQGDAQKARIQVDDIRKEWQSERGQASSPEIARMTRESAGFGGEENQRLAVVDLKCAQKDNWALGYHKDVQEEYKKETEVAEKQKEMEVEKGIGFADD